MKNKFIISIILIMSMTSLNELSVDTEELTTVYIEPIVEIEEPVKVPIYNIDLSEELQEYTYEICSEYDINYELILALMYTESRFNEIVVSPTGDYGLMQINKINHKWIKEHLGLDNLLDPYQNIKAGIHLISGHFNKYGDIHKSLMAYNMGETGMLNVVNNGHTSSRYSRLITKRQNELLKNGNFK